MISRDKVLLVGGGGKGLAEEIFRFDLSDGIDAIVFVYGYFLDDRYSRETISLNQID